MTVALVSPALRLARLGSVALVSPGLRSAWSTLSEQKPAERRQWRIAARPQRGWPSRTREAEGEPPGPKGLPARPPTAAGTVTWGLGARPPGKMRNDPVRAFCERGQPECSPEGIRTL